MLRSSSSNWTAEFAALPEGWERYPASRRAATYDDPILFALVYLPHHLRSKETGDAISFSTVHREWADYARTWMEPIPGPREARDAFVGPRGIGKSTWHFLILPMWAAAHGHIDFIAAFADSSTQAETHLQTFRHELDTNGLLRADFPTLCRPAKRGRRALSSPEGGTLVADNRGMLYAANDFVFAARGIDSSNLGLKVGNRRPQLLIFDDVEPEEAVYSSDQARKRLATITDGILPMNENARVVIVGTVTMTGSVIHQLVRSVREAGTDEVEPWIGEERIRVHYHPPFITADDGTESSTWPQRWSTEFLLSIRHTSSFAKNYANDPRGIEGGYWTEADIRYDVLKPITGRILSVDPAVTTKKRSDPTGIAVIGRQPANPRLKTKAMAQVEHAEAVRLTGSALRSHLLKIISRWDEAGTPISFILVETNQGGDLWREVFHHMPVPVKNVHQSESKEVRAAAALSWYQRGRVVHTERLHAAEDQMIGFPRSVHDDMVDAIGAGVLRVLDPPLKAVAGAESSSYL